MSSYREKKYSEDTARSIDEEVKKIVEEAHEYSRKILLERKDQVELLTQMLMEFETLDQQDVQDIVNHQWDIEKKRERLKRADELHKKKQVVPPPPPTVNSPSAEAIMPS